MRFSEWLVIDEIESAPGQPGLFQVKFKEGLLDYPTGKSAMVYYGYGDDLARALTAFREQILPLLELNEDDLLVRFMQTSDNETRFKNHLNWFHSNFGSLPLGNEKLLQKIKSSEKDE